MGPLAYAAFICYHAAILLDQTISETPNLKCIAAYKAEIVIRLAHSHASFIIIPGKIKSTPFSP